MDFPTRKTNAKKYIIKKYIIKHHYKNHYEIFGVACLVSYNLFRNRMICNIIRIPVLMADLCGQITR